MILETAGTVYDITDNLLPGILDALAEDLLCELESLGSRGIEIFRKFNVPALVIPTAHSGVGATPLKTVAVMRAIATKSPSLAAATAMHHFSVATLITLADILQASGFEWAMLEVIASQRMLVSSAFAEGSPGQSVISPTVTARRAAGGAIVNGSKSPAVFPHPWTYCQSAWLYQPKTALSRRLSSRFIPAQTEGVTIDPFWGKDILAGAESDEVRLADVFIDDQLTLPANNEGGALDLLQTIGFVWFELLITSCYLGAAPALEEKVFQRRWASSSVLSELWIRMETATLLLQRVAMHLQYETVDNRSLMGAPCHRTGVPRVRQRSAPFVGMAPVALDQCSLNAHLCKYIRRNRPLSSGRPHHDNHERATWQPEPRRADALRAGRSGRPGEVSSRHNPGPARTR